MMREEGIPPFGGGDEGAVRRRHALREKIRKAVEKREVFLAFQPVVSARHRDRVAFYEGLVRLYGPARDPIPAAEFIPLVETSELGRMIDCLALEQGLEALGREPSLRLSVNMSARSIGYRRWLDTLHLGLERDPTIAERLILEITEASAMLMPDLVSSFMGEMHRQGISFALDDFGAGYTAFRHLKDFLFDIVKIDGEYTRDIHHQPDSQVLVEALVTISRHFDMFTVAEAVETGEEADFLTAAGVDCLQGYLISPPMLVPPWEEKVAVLDDYID